MRIDNPYLVGKMLKSISPDSVRSGRTCPANLGVRSCPGRELICPVRLSPSRLCSWYLGNHNFSTFVSCSLNPTTNLEAANPECSRIFKPFWLFNSNRQTNKSSKSCYNWSKKIEKFRIDNFGTGCWIQPQTESFLLLWNDWKLEN